MTEDSAATSYRICGRRARRGSAALRGEAIDEARAASLVTTRVFPATIGRNEPVYALDEMVTYVVRRSAELGQPISHGDAKRILLADTEFLVSLGDSSPPDQPRRNDPEEEPF